MNVSYSESNFIGEIKAFHTFNGAVAIPRGWMVCDGSVVNSTNYEAIHSSGKYTTDQVATSPLAGKNLPNMVNRYMVGASSTTQSGSTAITAVGNASHQINLQHNHKWYENNASNTTDQSYDSGGSLQAITSGTVTKSGTIAAIVASSTNSTPPGDSWTNNGGSTTQNIQPDSIQVLFIIKVA